MLAKVCPRLSENRSILDEFGLMGQSGTFAALRPVRGEVRIQIEQRCVLGRPMGRHLRQLLDDSGATSELAVLAGGNLPGRVASNLVGSFGVPVLPDKMGLSKTAGNTRQTVESRNRVEI